MPCHAIVKCSTITRHISKENEMLRSSSRSASFTGVLSSAEAKEGPEPKDDDVPLAKAGADEALLMDRVAS